MILQTSNSRIAVLTTTVKMHSYPRGCSIPSSAFFAKNKSLQIFVCSDHQNLPEKFHHNLIRLSFWQTDNNLLIVVPVFNGMKQQWPLFNVRLWHHNKLVLTAPWFSKNDWFPLSLYCKNDCPDKNLRFRHKSTAKFWIKRILTF